MATGYDLARSLRGPGPSVPAILAVVCVLAALAVAIFGDPLWARAVRRRATADARAYAGQMHPGLTRVVCQGDDSDGDGYVTCTVGDGAGRTEGVECRATVWTDYDRGCRPMRAMVRAMGGAQ
jgi:hypothetical protein